MGCSIAAVEHPLRRAEADLPPAPLAAALPTAAEYLALYDVYAPLVKMDVAKFVEEYEAQDLTIAQMQSDVKKELEKDQNGRVTGVIVFNPNTDKALSMKGAPEAANDIWLLNWRKALDRAKKTGGRCVQIIVGDSVLT